MGALRLNTLSWLDTEMIDQSYKNGVHVALSQRMAAAHLKALTGEEMLVHDRKTEIKTPVGFLTWW